MNNRKISEDVYERFRKDVLKRDKRQCQMPGCKCKVRLQVHHIKTWASAASLRYETCNGITLCRSCHDSIKNKEKQYEKLFREIIDGKL
jgi:5-methylcytosine-specific restriction endonuclease McrA